MSIFGRNKRLSPFDDIGEKKAVRDVGPELSSEVPGISLDVRSSVFLGGLMLSTGLVFVYSDHVRWSLLGIAAIVFVWALILRFIERKSLIVLNVILNAALAISFGFIPNMPLTFADVTCYIPLAAGITVISSFDSDDQGVFVRPSLLRDVLYTAAASTVSVGLAGVLCLLTGLKSFPLVIFESVLVLTALSFVLSKITGKQILFSSAKLSDTSEVPLSDAEGKEFVFSVAVRKFFIILLCEVMMFAAEYGFFLDLQTVSFPIKAIIIKAAAVLFCDASAVLLSGVYKRRSVLTKKPVYVSGFPLIMIIVSVMLMFVYMLE